MTFSIVARDPVTGALGVAVQAWMFAVGTAVPWGGAGVGAGGTQGMAETFRASTDVFARRLVAALQAGQDAGGDARGVMSAALVVVDRDPSEPWAGRPIDLRVDRSDDPIGELSGLLDAAHAFAAYH